MATRKKYCIDCVHVFEEKSREWECNNPQNFKTYDTPLQQEKRRIRTIEQINKNNQCPWFKKKIRYTVHSSS